MKKTILFFCLCLIVLSCKKVLEKPHWNTEVLAPLVQSSLSIKNILSDTASFKQNTDQSLTIVHRSPLANITLDSLVSLNTPPFQKSVKLDSLILDNKTSTTKFSLGQIANGLIHATPPNFANILIGSTIISNNGGTYNVPNISNISVGSIDLDVTSFFETANIQKGNLQISIKNGLPLILQNVQFDITNKTSGTSVVSSTFASLAPGASPTSNKNLAGLTVEGRLLANITFDILGGTVLIDTSNALEVTLTISGVTVNSATAVFPAQDVVNNTDTTGLVGMNDVELTYAKIADGNIHMEVVSTVQDNIYFNYQIPSATKSGVPININLVVPPATSIKASTLSYDYPLSDYELDLTGITHTITNTFYSTLKGRIEYTGKEVYLSLSDSLTIKISTAGLKPSYLKGYLGKNTIHVGPSSIDIDLFKKIESGTLNFRDVNVTIAINNGTGLPAGITLNNLQAINSKTNSTVNYSGPLLATNIPVMRATDHPFSPYSTIIDVGASSNAVSLLNILPSKFNYDLQVITNPAGNDHTYQDFAYSKDSLSASLDIELPLSVISTKLVLVDTSNFNPGANGKQPIKKGTFIIYASNGFPIDALLKLFFVDENGTILDSVTTLDPVKAALLDANGRVSTKQLTSVSFAADEYKMQHIYATKKVIFKAEFTTVPQSSFLKIYSDYSIDFKLVGDLTYSPQ